MYLYQNVRNGKKLAKVKFNELKLLDVLETYEELPKVKIGRICLYEIEICGFRGNISLDKKYRIGK